MNQEKSGKTFFVFVILMAAVLSAAFHFADEKKTIPDHSSFPSCQPCHPEKVSMWEDSGHSKAIRLVTGNKKGATDCSSCHSPQSIGGKPPAPATDMDEKESFHKVACLACHSRQNTEYVHRLVMDPERLCTVCHSQKPIFWGHGAKGIEDLRNFHSGVPCISCHMTEGNHRMKVLRPDDPGLTGGRLDTCTACHKDNNRKGRVRQIQDWQSLYEETMKPLLADVKAIDEALNKKPDLLNDALKSKLDDVKYNLALLEQDGSRGFHNFVFMLEITANADNDLKQIKAAIIR
jgi:predicted CXXCH cytochrome family protein